MKEKQRPASDKKPARAGAAVTKTIGLLISGGDCAGLNAVIRAVVARAVQGYGWRLYGIASSLTGEFAKSG